MDDTQVDKILDELVQARKSFEVAASVFDQAVKEIRWTRIKTRILYGLMATVFLLGALLVSFYFDEKLASCREHNDIREAVSDSLDESASAIGVALEQVSGASHDRFVEFLEIYRDQDSAGALAPRDC